ncbi:venom allergen 3-like isoform X2 [Rhodnius prolixus]|uniref:venom allergen 3-like isoform X2 n=1 Tax=Rhodnius prolixus TaxID=13249 RepID=UPI003D18E570
MRIIQYYFLLYLVVPGESVRDTEYCCTYCSRRRTHTVCKYPKAGIGKDCVRFIRGSLIDKERTSLLNMHNSLRQLIAQGKIKQQPQGSNLVEMIWDDELEFIAKRWNDQCIYAHDDCRNSLRFVVGQNIAYTFSKTAESMTQFWFDEYLITPQSLINNMTEIEVFVKLSGEMKKSWTFICHQR